MIEVTINSLKKLTQDGQVLASELNDSTDLNPEEREYLETLLTQLNTLSRDALPGKSPDQEMIRGVNALLQRYKWVVQLTGVSASSFFFFDLPVLEPSFDPSGTELSAIVIGLARNGLLNRVRRC